MCVWLSETNPSQGVGLVILRKALRLSVGLLRLIVWATTSSAISPFLCTDPIKNYVYQSYLRIAGISILLSLHGSLAAVYNIPLVILGASLTQIECDSATFTSFITFDWWCSVIIVITPVIISIYRWYQQRRPPASTDTGTLLNSHTTAVQLV